MPERPTSDSESLSLPTLKARDHQAEGYEAGLRRATPQLGTIVKGIVDGDNRVIELFRSPTASQGEGGALGEAVARERGNTVGIRDQAMDIAKAQGLKVSRSVANLPTPTVSDQYTANLTSTQQSEGSLHSVSLAQVFHRTDLFPTPNTMDSLPARSGEARERNLHRGGSTSRRTSSGNLREDVVYLLPKTELLPTPNTMEHREVKTPEQIAALKAKSPGGYRNLRESVVNELFPTPIVRDYKDGSAAQSRNGKVSTDTVARAIFNSGEVTDTDWGKFEPAIRRWEATIGRPAPEPTKPDGKEGNHRLSSKFTEWMMGLPEGWITDIGLKRNDELKACGNGVVPQQAELALSLLGIKEILERS